MKKLLLTLLTFGVAASVYALDATVMGSEFTVLNFRERYIDIESDKIDRTNFRGEIIINSANVPDGQPMQALAVYRIDGDTITDDIIVTFTPEGNPGRGVFSLMVEDSVGGQYVAIGNYRSSPIGQGSKLTRLSSKGAGVSDSPSYSAITVRLNGKLSGRSKEDLIGRLGLDSGDLDDVGSPIED